MIEKQITVFETVCGKQYKHISTARAHEKICRCWTNPESKTCLTCDHFEGNAYEYFLCDKFPGLDKAPIPAHEKASFININCPFWQQQ